MDKYIATGIMKIYSNPVNDYVYVTVPGNLDRQSLLSIFDARGVLVRTVNMMTNNLQRIYVGVLPKGVYLIKLNKGAGNFSTKFVRQYFLCINKHK